MWRVSGWEMIRRILKKTRYDAVRHAQAECAGGVQMKVSCLCARARMSRQNFYKERKRRRHDAVDEGLVKTLVNEERRIQPRLGGQKLYVLLKDTLASCGVKLGRDRFFLSSEVAMSFIESSSEGAENNLQWAQSSCV